MRRSTTGYVYKVGSGVVSWMLRMHDIVTLSTIEDEFVVLITEVAKKIIWLKRLLGELGMK